jgi:hypothetical protein
VLTGIIIRTRIPCLALRADESQRTDARVHGVSLHSGVVHAHGVVETGVVEGAGIPGFTVRADEPLGAMACALRKATDSDVVDAGGAVLSVLTGVVVSAGIPGLTLRSHKARCTGARLDGISSGSGIVRA